MSSTSSSHQAQLWAPDLVFASSRNHTSAHRAGGPKQSAASWSPRSIGSDNVVEGSRRLVSLSKGTATFGVVTVAAAVVITAVPMAATAQADSKSYIDNLHSIGVNTPRGDLEVKEWGWEVCALTARGVPADKVLAQAVYNSRSTPPYGMTAEQAAGIMHFALTDLCTSPGQN